MITEAHTQKLIEVIRSAEFRTSYDYFLQRPKDIITNARQIEDLYTWEELEESYKEWLWLYSRLAYKIDRAAFSPTWLPICKGLDYHVDLNKPQWPVYEMWGCGMWDWEMRVHTLSMRALSAPLGNLHEYVDVERYNGGILPDSGRAKIDYFNALRQNSYVLEKDWQSMLPSRYSCFYNELENIGAIENFYPYHLNKLPADLSIEVTEFVVSSWYSSTDYSILISRVKSIQQLVYLLYLGVWREIDKLVFVSADLITYTLTSNRTVKPIFKKLCDNTSWDLEFYPFHEPTERYFKANSRLENRGHISKDDFF